MNNMYINNDIDYVKFAKNKNIYVFGAGVMGNAFCNKVLRGQYNYRIIAFVDNNVLLQGTNGYKNIPIISFERMREVNNQDSLIVICNVQHEKEIKEQLIYNNIYNFVSVTQFDFGGGVECYDEAYFEWQKTMGEFGARIKCKMFQKYIGSDDVLVEFGSGGGYLLNALEAREKIGIEINDSARKNSSLMGIQNVKTTNELPDEFADIIISTSVLEHVENPLGELRQLYKKLKKGGTIVFHVPNESCYTEYVPSEINNHLYTWNCLNIGNLFKAAGFFVHSVELVQEVWPHNYEKISKEVSPELFEELQLIGGKTFDENRCLIVGYK